MRIASLSGLRGLAGLAVLVPVLALFGACSDDDKAATPPVATDAGVEPQSPEDVKPVALEGTVDDCPDGFKDGPPKAGWNRGFLVSGQKRNFWVIYPDGEPSGPQPVFVAFNGTSENGEEFADRASLKDFAKRGMVVLAPSSNGNGERWPIWDSLRPEGKENDPNPDIDLVDTLLKCVSAHRPLDKNRVYAGGHSAGGIFTNNIIQRRSELFAGAIVASGIFTGTSPVPVPTMDKMVVLVTWGGNNDTYTGAAGTSQVKNVAFAPEASLASKFYSGQKNVGHGACKGNELKHVWISTLNNWFVDVLLGHPKGFLKAESFELPPAPANARATCTTEAYDHKGTVSIQCGESKTDGCQQACQFFASCGAENDTVRGVLAKELATLGIKGTDCGGCITRCEQKSIEAEDAEVLSCIKAQDVSKCGQGIAGALPLVSALTDCCDGKKNSGYCKDTCGVIKTNSTALSYFPVCEQF